MMTQTYWRSCWAGGMCLLAGGLLAPGQPLDLAGQRLNAQDVTAAAGNAPEGAAGSQRRPSDAREEPPQRPARTRYEDPRERDSLAGDPRSRDPRGGDPRPDPRRGGAGERPQGPERRVPPRVRLPRRGERDRERHLRLAIEHLREAGLTDEAARLESRHLTRRDRDDPARERDTSPGQRQDDEGLMTVRQLRKAIEELSVRISRSEDLGEAVRAAHERIADLQDQAESHFRVIDREFARQVEDLQRHLNRQIEDFESHLREFTQEMEESNSQRIEGLLREHEEEREEAAPRDRRR